MEVHSMLEFPTERTPLEQFSYFILRRLRKTQQSAKF